MKTGQASKIDAMAHYTLAIESSCDETSAAVILDGTKALSNIVASQVDIHSNYGGVVPEIASRMHVELILQTVDKALGEAGIEASRIDGVAVTNGPGLIGSLMVGISAAKALAFALDKPLIGVNHLEAHLSAVHLENDVDFPFAGLVVSGGHTSIYFVKDHTDCELMGKTRDDAAGEAFDKAAKVLGLGYPGGVQIDRLAAEGDRHKIPFPRPFNRSDTYDFSFSGIKTSLVYYLKNNPDPDEVRMKDICAGYQEAIVETLVDKTLQAAIDRGVGTAVISGGVACNSRLRMLASEKFAEEGINLFIPSPVYCTDNAAMIGVLGGQMLLGGEASELDLTPFSTKRPKHMRRKSSSRGRTAAQTS